MLHEISICCRLPSFQNITLISPHDPVKEAQRDAECFLGVRNGAEASHVFLQSSVLPLKQCGLHFTNEDTALLKDLLKPLQLGKCNALAAVDETDQIQNHRPRLQPPMPLVPCVAVKKPHSLPGPECPALTSIKMISRFLP